MNLLAKIWLGLLIVAILSIISCEDPSEIGLGLNSDGLRVNVLYTEIPLKMKNVLIDSIRTSRDSRILIGTSDDLIFGKTSSVFYSQLNYINNIQSITYSSATGDSVYTDLKYVIDSTVLSLRVRKVHGKDVTAQQSYKIHQLTDTLFSGPYYLSEFETPYRTDRTEGEFQFVLNEVRIGDTDSIPYILQHRMEDRMGEELFSIRKGDNSPTGSAQTDLKYSYKGIAIVGNSTTNTTLIGIDPIESTELTIHYHILDPYKSGDPNALIGNVDTDSIFSDSLRLSLSLGSSSVFYNRLSTDRAGSLMAAENGANNSFSIGDGNTYLQPVSGIYPKVDFGALVNFFNNYPNIQINRMELELETKSNPNNHENTRDLRFFLIDSLDGSKINSAGIVSSYLFETAILTDNGYLAATQEVLNLPIDEDSKSYSGLATIFAQLIESKKLEMLQNVLIIPSDVTSPNYSVFDEESGMRIKLYYTLPE